MQLRQVIDYHSFMRNKGANMTFMAFTRPTSTHEWYSRGWVVSGYRGEDSHRYFHNKTEAIEFMNSKEVALHKAQMV